MAEITLKLKLNQLIKMYAIKYKESLIDYSVISFEIVLLNQSHKKFRNLSNSFNNNN